MCWIDLNIAQIYNYNKTIKHILMVTENLYLDMVFKKRFRNSTSYYEQQLIE